MKKIFVIIAFIAVVVPAIFVIQEAGGLGNWQGVVPRGTTDSLYYYARIHEVIDGHPFIGNPYVYEYRDTYSPAFFLPDIVSAVPMLLGMPFDIGVVANAFVWIFIFLIASFALFRLLGLPSRWSLIWSVLLFVTAYSFMLRPTVMQLVYPAFLAFLVALIRFLREPTGQWRVMWLSLASAASFYIYTYLAYIVLLTLTFIFFRYLIARRFEELRALVVSGALSAFLLIPFGIYTFFQTMNPLYLDTLRRIGLMYTRVPTIESVFYGRWIVIALVALGFMWWTSRGRGDYEDKNHVARNVFLLSTGVSLLIGLFMNVATGVELSLAIHIGRFVLLWMVIALGSLFYDSYSKRAVGKNTTWYVALALLILLSAGVARNLSRGLDFYEFNKRGDVKISELQTYAGPLSWLDEHVPEESVVWANESISEYIPVMTRHYPLFFHGAVLHNIPSKDLEDRYLLSKSRGTLTLEEIRNDHGLYSGELPLREEEYFEGLVERLGEVKNNPRTFLEKFGVDYLIVDRIRDGTIEADFDEVLYDDGRFIVASISF